MHALSLEGMLDLGRLLGLGGVALVLGGALAPFCAPFPNMFVAALVGELDLLEGVLVFLNRLLGPRKGWLPKKRSLAGRGWAGLGWARLS